jgi:hypothetical protein
MRPRAARPIEPVAATMPLDEALPTPSSSEKKVDWELAKSCLAELHREAPILLRQGVIIGGIACWFYRHLLKNAQDPDFKVPELSATQEQLWLSKDIDFTNFFAQDARDLLKNHIVKDSQGRLLIKLAGVPIGFAQVGVTFDPEAAWTESWIGTFTWNDTVVEFRVLHPITLFREKVALSQKRGAESDHLHCALVAEFLRYETCKRADALAKAVLLNQRTQPLRFLHSIQSQAREVCNDTRVRRRLEDCVQSARDLAPAEQKLLEDLSSSNGLSPQH